MPPKTPADAQDAEHPEKRARKSVDRLSSSKLQAKQYSALALGSEERKPDDDLSTAAQVANSCVDPVASLETLICTRCKRADHEDKMLLCDLCDKGWHLFCLKPPLQAIPEGDWSCPHCAAREDTAHGKDHKPAAVADGAQSIAAVEEEKAAANPRVKADTGSMGVPSKHSDAVAESKAVIEGKAKSAATPGSSAKWSRPTREEGAGGAWMIGRRVQVWCDSQVAWREGSVDGVDMHDEKMHTVLFVDSSDSQAASVNLSKVRWKLDRSQDSLCNPKSARQIEDEAPVAGSLPGATQIKRGRGRPKKNLAQHASKATITMTANATVSESSVQASRIVVQASRVIDPNACKEPLRKKHEMLMEALEDTPIYVAVGGAKGKKGRREGVLEYDDVRKQVMVRSGDKQETLEAFVESQLGFKDRPKEHVFLTKNDESLVEYESTLSGYGRQKLVDGTRVRLMFDNDDWYPGKIIGYDSHTARYRLVFEDGEEVEARHALFEPDDGFFLDNGKDCGMVFRASASASCRAALAAEQDADKDRWRAPRPGEEDGGEWMVGRRIRVFWSFDNKFHEAVVEEYDPDADAVDSRGLIGPVHRLRYDESKHTGVFPENLTKCVWNLDKSQDRDRPTGTHTKRAPNSSVVQKKEEAGPKIEDHPTRHIPSPKLTSAANVAAGRPPKAKASAAAQGVGLAKDGVGASIDEGKCMWTAPHWKFKTGGQWLVGRKIKLYWDAERQWFAGKVLSYDDTPHAQDSHGNVGPVHEVYYDDGVFFENLECARWKLDANEGPSGNPLVHEWETDIKKERMLPSKDAGRRVEGKGEVRGRGHEGKNDSAEADDGCSKRRSADVQRNDAGDLRGDVAAKRAKHAEKDIEKNSRRSLPEDSARAGKKVQNAKVGMGARSSLPGGKVVLKLPKMVDGDAGVAISNGKRGLHGEASNVLPEKHKKLKKEEVPAIDGKKDGTMHTGNAEGGVDLSRLNMQDRRWTSPDEVRRTGGRWLLDRCVRLYWDEEAQWFPGIVISYDGRKDALDSHGSKGPVHTIVYEDGPWRENLSTAKWQFDAKEGLAGVNVHGEVEPDVADEMADEMSGPATPPEAGISGDAAESEAGANSDKVSTQEGKDNEDTGKGDEQSGKGWRGECDKLLGRLLRQDNAIPFLEPVDTVAMQLPDYFEIIKKPMDLGTVKSKLQRNDYKEPVQVLRDILQCFNNAIEYNPASEPAHKMAIAMHTSFTSLCNGSQLLRPVLRCLDLSGGGVKTKTGTSGPSPKKLASSPKKKSLAASVAEKDAEKKATASTGKHSNGSRASLLGKDEEGEGADPKKKSDNDGSGANRLPEDGEQFRLKIHTEGRVWTEPSGHFRKGGSWLVGRHIRVYWDDDRKWYAGVVTYFDGSASEDSHGNTGPVHDVYYEDGSFLENLGTATWQYDAKEGSAGQSVDLGEDLGGQGPSSDKKPATGPVVHRNPYAACDDCRRRRIRCKHMHEAAAALLPKKEATKVPAVNKSAGAGGTARQVPLAVSVAAAPEDLPVNKALDSPTKKALDSPTKKVPSMLPAEQIRGIKKDLWRKEVEYEVAYGPGKTQWSTTFSSDSNFKRFLVDFIQRAFPDHSFMHPWMKDFKSHMFSWGYREKQLCAQGTVQEKNGLEDIVAVSGVQVLDGATMYRTTSENPTRHKWHAVNESTSTKVHKMAADFLFTQIGVVSLYMGREKISKFLRHLGVLQEYERGWEASEQGLLLNKKRPGMDGQVGAVTGAADMEQQGAGVDLPLFDDGFFQPSAECALAANGPSVDVVPNPGVFVAGQQVVMPIDGVNGGPEGSHALVDPAAQQLSMETESGSPRDHDDANQDCEAAQPSQPSPSQATATVGTPEVVQAHANGAEEDTRGDMECDQGAAVAEAPSAGGLASVLLRELQKNDGRLDLASSLSFGGSEEGDEPGQGDVQGGEDTARSCVDTNTKSLDAAKETAASEASDACGVAAVVPTSNGNRRESDEEAEAGQASPST